MWSDKSHPMWRLLAIGLIAGTGLLYSQLAYQNGADIKDGGLISLVAGLAALATKFFMTETKN